MESFYYGNQSLFKLKLALMKLAMKQVNTGKILFLIGRGGDGKGLDSILDKNIFGEENFCTLDCAVFTERQEFRKSGHFGQNKTCIRIQEFTKQKHIISDLWKRFVSGEEIDVRQNYGFT